jgi:hypothetical protein
MVKAPRLGAERASRLMWDAFVRLHLRGVWLQGDVPRGPFVWAMNHHHWWDAVAAATALRTLGADPVVFMDADSLGRFGFLRRAGAVGSDETLRVLSLLRSGGTLVIMPEGSLRAAGALGFLHRGAVTLAALSDLPLVPVAARVVLRGHEFPEAYFSVGTSVPVTRGDGPGGLASALGGLLGELDATLRTADPELPPPGFRRVVRGRRSVSEILSAADRLAAPFRRAS